jgi:hypothetical protein
MRIARIASSGGPIRFRAATSARHPIENCADLAAAETKEAQR